MAVCDVQELLSANPCLSALNSFDLEVLITSQLCSIKEFLESAEPVTCDVQELLTAGACFRTLSLFELKVVQAQLLCDIASLL